MISYYYLCIAALAELDLYLWCTADKDGIYILWQVYTMALQQIALATCIETGVNTCICSSLIVKYTYSHKTLFWHT